MINLGVQFALPTQTFAESLGGPASNSGIGAFNINLKSFFFQLVTFAIVLLVFKRWILPPILRTLEQRRKTLEESLVQAKQTQEALAKAETRSEEMVHLARTEADKALAAAKTEAREIVAKAEEDARLQTERIIAENKEMMDQQRDKIRQEIKSELVDLVTKTTERVLRKKIDASEDRRLIEDSLKEMAR